MGVRDLLPTLRKLVPSSIQSLESLSHLPPRRTRFAIDGNLLTTKFHFSPSSSSSLPSAASDLGSTTSSNRHVKSWYNFLNELEKRGIDAVVVFDGEGRKVEKERERQRRRDARDLQRARGEAERIRTERLTSFKEIWDQDGGKLRDEGRGQGARGNADKFWEIYDEYKGDRENPVYSKTQETVTKQEGDFYESILARSSLLVPSSIPFDKAPSRSSSATPDTSPVESPTLSEGNSEDSQETLGSPSSPTYDPDSSSTRSAPDGSRDDATTSLPMETPERPIPCNSAPQPISTEPISDPPFLPPPTPPETDAVVPSPEALVDFDYGLDALISKSAQLSKSHLSRSVSVPFHVFEDVKALISSMGYPVLTPSPKNPFEAESICSLLYHERDLTGVTHIVSEDTDVLVYSAPLLRRITTVESGGFERDKRRKKGIDMSIVDPVQVRNGLGLGSREAFTDWCLLCGTDFTERLPLLGPKKALSLVRQFGSIENIFRDTILRSKYFPPPLPPLPPSSQSAESGPVTTTTTTTTAYEDYMERIRAARSIFLDLPRLSDVVEEGETFNFKAEGEGSGKGVNHMAHVGEETAERVLSEWFERKRENRSELEKLKRRFGIVRGGSERDATAWEDDLMEIMMEMDVDEIYEDVETELDLQEEEEKGTRWNDVYLTEEEFFERAEGWNRGMDEQAADVWLEENGRDLEAGPSRF